jgi:hypothetical protein
MAVRAPHPEGAHAGDQCPPLIRPWTARGLDAEAELVEGDVRVRILKVEAGGELAVLYCKSCLD